MKNKFLSIIAVGLLIFGASSLANAATISYTATDLPDVNIGEDLWQYSYTVSDHTFTADTGFTIYFDLGLFDLLDPFSTAPNADWDVLTWDPDSSIPADGAYDAYTFVDNASLTDTFSVNFEWLGGGSGPGLQYFEIYDGVTWEVLKDGFTSSGNSSIPEPATTYLFGIGLVIFISSNIRQKSRHINKQKMRVQ